MLLSATAVLTNLGQSSSQGTCGPVYDLTPLFSRPSTVLFSHHSCRTHCSGTEH